MKPMSLFFTAAVVLAAAPAAKAATPWSQTVTVTGADFNPDTPGGTSVLVVDAAEGLLLTDVVMTHNHLYTRLTFRANIRRGDAFNDVPCASASPVLTPFVSPVHNVSLNLSTGILFLPGEQICIVVENAHGTDGIVFNLSGATLP